MNLSRLEEYRVFSIAAWIVIALFALFTLRVVQALVNVSEEIDEAKSTRFKELSSDEYWEQYMESNGKIR